MKWLYLLTISFQNIITGKTRSILTVLAVSIGFSTIIFLLAAGYGIQKIVTSQASTPDTLSIFEVSLEDSEKDKIEDKNVSKIRDIDNVRDAEPAIVLPGKIMNGQTSTDVAVKGFTKKYFELSELKLSSGKFFEEGSSGDILISSGALAKINPKSGATGNLKIDASVVTDKNISPSLDDGKVEDISKLHIYGVVDDDNPYIIMPMKLLSRELSTENYNIIKVKVKDKGKIETTRKEIEKIGLSTNYIGDTIKQINTFFSIFRYIVGGFGLTATIVAIVGMFNTLIVSLIERTQEIGILKSHGARKKDIWFLFVSESVMLSVGGGIAGIIFGVAISLIANLIYNLYAQFNGGVQASLFSFPAPLFLYVILASVVIGLLTGLYPAKRAAKIKILDAIKYE